MTVAEEVAVMKLVILVKIEIVVMKSEVVWTESKAR